MDALIVWTPDLEICGLVDKQHKQLVELLNKFYDGYVAQAKYDDMLDILRELKRYSVYHFKTEELLFEFADEPGKFEKHKSEHQYFIKKISEFAFKYFYDPKQLDKEILDFLKDWTLHHIREVDKEYKPLCDSLSDEDFDSLLQKVEQIFANGIIDDLSKI